jgi:proline-specific peptidase
MKTLTPLAGATVPWRNFRTWTVTLGAREIDGRLPILALHGGPGVPSDYLLALEPLTANRRVILYDQVGCGRSTPGEPPAEWVLDLFLEELSAVRRALGLNQVHVLGHSWGGMLAIEHALTEAPGVASLTLVCTPPSVPQWVEEVQSLVHVLPMAERLALMDSMASERPAGEAFEQAMEVFDERHGCRVQPIPVALQRSLDAAHLDPRVREAMWGPHPFHPTGTLAQWDIRDRLDEIRAPTIVLGGRHDTVTPNQMAALQRAIPYAESHLFEHSAHYPHLEESAAFTQVVEDFLERVEAYL